jgi:hypothetical protein
LWENNVRWILFFEILAIAGPPPDLEQTRQQPQVTVESRYRQSVLPVLAFYFCFLLSAFYFSKKPSPSQSKSVKASQSNILTGFSSIGVSIDQSGLTRRFRLG